MYSRAARRFLEPDADHANPNLGPGCYTADEATLIAGKTLGENGYAPFSSLAPRVSYFEESVIHGPSPGAYDPLLQPLVVHNTEKAALFGKSRAIRFKNIVSFTPSPNTYILPSSLKKVENKRASTSLRGLEEFPLDYTKLGDTITFQGVGTTKANIPSKSKGTEQQISQDDSNGAKPDINTEEITTKVAKISKPKRVIVKSAEPRPSIIWRRKYVPPSIPVGRSAFGYQENESGDLVPRSPPKRSVDPGPAYNFVTSFVEKNKHEKNGFRFAKDKKGLKFAVTDSPGPSVYDVSFAEKLMKAREYGNGPAVMTLAPCVRLTDEILTDALKKAVPGPGAYDLSSKIQHPRMPGANVPGFGSSSNHAAPSNYIPTDMMKTPAPGTYYPEFATINKPPAYRPQPFGSTTSRFDNTAEERSRQEPAPGSYELASFETSNLGERRARLMTPGGSRPKAFGSVSERFIKSKPQKAPGPGQYDIANLPSSPVQKASKFGGIHTGLPSRKMSPRNKMKKQIVVARLGTVDPQKIRLPVFGTQAARFHKTDDLAALPPPGAYEIAHAFESLKTKGRMDKQGLLASYGTRELFPPPSNVPGPGECKHKKMQMNTEILIIDNAYSEIRRTRHEHQHGAFLSSKLRFDIKPEVIPGPDAYLNHDYDNGLLKKSFNITFREWND
ncbi:Sperm-tail PG-rich repeat-containing protein 2 [Entophlyctis luteolus]|nr:Sperm-tail PG-rich repeat-containing protein 2 [Entophlyctis luteolus]